MVWLDLDEELEELGYKPVTAWELAVRESAKVDSYHAWRLAVEAEIRKKGGPEADQLRARRAKAERERLAKNKSTPEGRAAYLAKKKAEYRNTMADPVKAAARRKANREWMAKARASGRVKRDVEKEAAYAKERWKKIKSDPVMLEKRRLSVKLANRKSRKNKRKAK